MAKRPSKHLRPPRPLLAGHATAATKADGRWVVRSVPGSAAVKTYRCPGCNQPVPPGTAHVVVWPAEPVFTEPSPVAERRHWHTSCWRRRS